VASVTGWEPAKRNVCSLLASAVAAGIIPVFADWRRKRLRAWSVTTPPANAWTRDRDPPKPSAVISKKIDQACSGPGFTYNVGALAVHWPLIIGAFDRSTFIWYRCWYRSLPGLTSVVYPADGHVCPRVRRLRPEALRT